MDDKLFDILGRFRACFSREVTYNWFIIIMLGMIIRLDHYGVSSIVRWLSLTPKSYLLILHFYHSNGWELRSILLCWWRYCFEEAVSFKVNNRAVLIGDHTNQPKDGRKMPGVVTIHQDSETSTKPSYYRGHVWGFISLLIGDTIKYFAIPLWGELNNKARNEKDFVTMTTRIVQNAISIAIKMDCCVYLTLDAFFAAGPVFLTAGSVYHVVFKVQIVHIITRAKKSAVGYEDPLPSPPGKRGRKGKYGKWIKLTDLFTDKLNDFLEKTANVYGQTEIVKILCIDLLWKPIGQKIRFVLAVTSRGPIVLMSSDLSLSPVQTLEIYCRRAAIESMFSFLKNLIGGLRYHFWCKLMEKNSRRPKKNKKETDYDEKVPDDIIERKLRSIEMFVSLSAILVGILQVLALKYPQKIWDDNTHWLRTKSSAIPSEYIVKVVLTQKIFNNLRKVNPHAIYRLIRSKQDDTEEFLKAA